MLDQLSRSTPLQYIGVLAAVTGIIGYTVFGSVLRATPGPLVGPIGLVSALAIYR